MCEIFRSKCRKPICIPEKRGEGRERLRENKLEEYIWESVFEGRSISSGPGNDEVFGFKIVSAMHRPFKIIPGLHDFHIRMVKKVRRVEREIDKYVLL
jgi:hypothetical protein